MVDVLEVLNAIVQIVGHIVAGLRIGQGRLNLNKAASRRGSLDRSEITLRIGQGFLRRIHFGLRGRRLFRLGEVPKRNIEVRRPIRDPLIGEGIARFQRCLHRQVVLVLGRSQRRV